MAVFVIKNTSVYANNTQIDVSMTTKDLITLRSNISRLPAVANDVFDNKINMICDVIEIEEPLTTLSYDYVNEYNVEPKNVYDLIDSYLQEKNYDYIYVVVKFGDAYNYKDVLLQDWIGLRRYGLLSNRFFKY